MTTFPILAFTSRTSSALAALNSSAALPPQDAARAWCVGDGAQSVHAMLTWKASVRSSGSGGVVVGASGETAEEAYSGGWWKVCAALLHSRSSALRLSRGGRARDTTRNQRVRLALGTQAAVVKAMGKLGGGLG